MLCKVSQFESDVYFIKQSTDFIIRRSLPGVKMKFEKNNINGKVLQNTSQ